MGGDATLAWINGSENIAIDDSDVYDIYGAGSSSDCEDADGEDKNIQINEGDISGKFGDDATLAWINGSKNVAIDNSRVNGEGRRQELPPVKDEQDAAIPPQDRHLL